jgi:hypothetical protein
MLSGEQIYNLSPLWIHVLKFMHILIKMYDVLNILLQHFRFIGSQYFKPAEEIFVISVQVFMNILTTDSNRNEGIKTQTHKDSIISHKATAFPCGYICGLFFNIWTTWLNFTNTGMEFTVLKVIRNSLFCWIQSLKRAGIAQSI